MRRRGARGRRRAASRGWTFLLACAGFLAFAWPIAQAVLGGAQEADVQWPVPSSGFAAPDAHERATDERPITHGDAGPLTALPLVPIADDYDEPTIDVYNAQAGRLETLPLETYVLGVVAGEMPSSYHDAALEAQAVAARTFAVYHMRSLGGKGCTKHAGADVCTDSGHCQAYAVPASSALDTLTSAVHNTQGRIVTYEGKPIEVLFHSTSGGETEDVENVFSESLPYLRSVVSRGEENAPKYESTKTYTKAEFLSIVRKAYPRAALSSAKLAQQVVVESRTAAGRVNTLLLGNVRAKGTDIRSLLGLNSTNFTVAIDEKSVTFHVRGYGHGVGMSQVGADSMAANGANYEEILKHYYTGTSVEMLPSQP